jgi:NAD-dependent SIR2 family protein deacetylase
MNEIPPGKLGKYLVDRTETVRVRCKCGAEYYASAKPGGTHTYSYCQYCCKLGLKKIIEWFNSRPKEGEIGGSGI